MNVFDLSFQYTISDILISITLFVLSFVAFFYFGFFRDSKDRQDENYKFKDMLIEGYFHKFDEYNEIISDIRTKLDMIEIKVNSVKVIGDHSDSGVLSDMDSTKSQHISHSIPVTKNVIITQNRDEETDEENRVNTVDSILKMLEVPLTSREIQRRINKSREHTSRLLKKLYSEKIVMRDGSNRPYKYRITNEGRKLLERTTNSGQVH
jgi:predicted transcriptional regulator